MKRSFSFIFPEKNPFINLSLSLSLQKSRIATTTINATLDGNKDRTNRPVYRINYSWAKVTPRFPGKIQSFSLKRLVGYPQIPIRNHGWRIIKETIITYINPFLSSTLLSSISTRIFVAWNPAGINRRIKERNYERRRAPTRGNNIILPDPNVCDRWRATATLLVRHKRSNAREKGVAATPRAAVALSGCKHFIEFGDPRGPPGNGNGAQQRIIIARDNAV